MTDDEIKLQIFTSVLSAQYIAAPNWAMHGTNAGSPDEFLDHASMMMIKGFERFKKTKDTRLKQGDVDYSKCGEDIYKNENYFGI
jgi:hypothetical protein